MAACPSPRPCVARPPPGPRWGMMPKSNPHPSSSSSSSSSSSKPVLHGTTRSKSPRARAPTGIRAADLPPADVTWQIAVGALAGVTPFIVAGIEFGKRIAAQRRCGVCGGSGLVQRDGYYARCPGCGGFLPWQSWKRFFTG